MKNAKKFKVFDENGKELKDYKNVANELNEQESFSMVSNKYHIIQHEDVYNTVQDVIKDKNLNANVRPNASYNGNGGRLHIEATFPDIKLDVENNGIQAQLYCTYDNSYDGTTGLRLTVGAKRGNAILVVVGSRYYHKHTKSVSVKNFESSLEQGINDFQSKIKGHFMGMFKTATNEVEALSFLDRARTIKGVSKIYVDDIESKVKQSTIKNKWQLYCIVCEVITEKASSLDVRDRQLKAIIGGLHKMIKSTDEQVTPQEGVTLQEVATNHTSQTNQESVTVPDSVELPEGIIAMELVSTPTQLTIDRKGKRKFAVMQGDTELRTFRKYKQAQRFLENAA